METMKRMVFEYEATGNTEGIELAGMGIRRTKDHEVITRNETKTFRVTADKRVLYENFIMFPYGF